jgi:RHS repeat-associated protein
MTYNNFGYDNGGNQTTISPYTVSYDVENRQSGFTSTSNGSATYTYDGDGRRVEKTAGGVTTTYVYDATGNLAAEYSSQPPPMPCQTCYLTTDHLGSTRAITSQTGGLVSRHDFLPFGEELVTTNRTAAQGYGVADNVMQRYTGQQRDLEGPVLDFFGARYFQGAQGRFTGPDPKQVTRKRVSDPQQWNQYAYTRNNPLKYFDPDGRELKLTIYSGTLTSDVATASANYMATTLRNAGVKNVTYDVKPGSPSLLQVIGYQMGPTPHSVLVELRPDKTGEPAIRPLESGHNWGGQAAVDTSLVTKQTNDPSQQAIGIGNLGVHEVGHEVTPFHPEGDPIMDRSANDENLFNPGLNFGPGMSSLLQQKYNSPGEVEQTPPSPQPPPPPPMPEKRP